MVAKIMYEILASLHNPADYTARKTSIVVFYINRVIDGSLLLLFATVVATLAETVAAAVATCM